MSYRIDIKWEEDPEQNTYTYGPYKTLKEAEKTVHEFLTEAEDAVTVDVCDMCCPNSKKDLDEFIKILKYKRSYHTYR